MVDMAPKARGVMTLKPAALGTPSIFGGQAIVTPQPNEPADPLKLSQLPGSTEDDATPAFNPLFQGSSSDTSSAGTTMCLLDLSRIIDALLPFIHWYVGRFGRFFDEAAARI